MNLEKKKVNIRLLYNENHLGVSPLALRALSEYVEHSNRYPINTLAKLLSYLHNLYDLPFYNFDSLYDEKVFFEVEKESKILLGVGSTEILRAVALCYGKGGGEIIEASPAYSFVSSSAKQIWGNSIKIVNVPLSIDYRHDWKSFVKVLSPNTKVVVVTNPNNPTGTALSYDELVLLADNLENDILLVIDEAYIELATTPDVRSMVDLTKHRSNILITRTFSKFYGLAGLRLGYGIGSACVIEKIRNYLVGLMGINKLAAVAAYASLKDRDYQNRTVEMVNQGKKKMMAELINYNFQPIPSETNFIWVNVKQDCKQLIHYLRSEGIYVASGYRWSQPDHIRISIGEPSEMDSLISALAPFRVKKELIYTL